MPFDRRALALAALLALAAAGVVRAEDPPPAALCDNLAAHPFDDDRFGEGVMIDHMDGERAVAACAAAVQAEPDNMRLVYQLGRALSRLDNHAEAVPHLRRAAQAGNLAAMYTLGDTLLYHDGGKAGGAEEGLSWIRRAAERGFVPAISGLGQAYAEGRGVARDDAAADEHYRRAAATGNPFAQLQAAGRFDDRAGTGAAADPALLAEAERLYRASAAQGWRDAYNELAWFLYVRERGDLAEAERFARRAVAAWPADAASADTLGAILLRRGRPAEAVIYLAYAATTEDDNADFQERYGDALWALDRRDQAREAWNEALAATDSENQRQRLRERLARQ